MNIKKTFNIIFLNLFVLLSFNLNAAAGSATDSFDQEESSLAQETPMVFSLRPFITKSLSKTKTMKKENSYLEKRLEKHISDIASQSKLFDPQAFCWLNNSLYDPVLLEDVFQGEKYEDLVRKINASYLQRGAQDYFAKWKSEDLSSFYRSMIGLLFLKQQNARLLIALQSHEKKLKSQDLAQLNLALKDDSIEKAVTLMNGICKKDDNCNEVVGAEVQSIQKTFEQFPKLQI